MSIAVLENSRERLHARYVDASTPTERDRLMEVESRPPGLLIADDEPWILYLIGQAARKLGCAVWLAANGCQALSTYQRAANRIDLILLDVNMPVLDGPQAFAALRQVNPEARCCFLSGSDASYTSEELHQLGVLAVLEKPFHPRELAIELLRLIETPEAAPARPLVQALRLRVPA